MMERLSFMIGNTRVAVVEGDIGEASTDVVVNAANQSSFTLTDGGISGALRNACSPDCQVVIGAEKQMWDDDGLPEALSRTIPVGRAGAHAAAGGLAMQGVKHIVHAVGPKWRDFDVEDIFDTVPPQIYSACIRALAAADHLNASSMTIPAISGGIFTHKAPPELQEREQVESRRSLFKALEAHCTPPGRTQLTEVVVIDLPSAHPASCIDLLLQAAEECAARLGPASKRADQEKDGGGGGGGAGSDRGGKGSAMSADEWEPLEAGSYVRIHSLKGRPELNGRNGRILRYDSAKGRYAVRVHKGTDDAASDASGSCVLLKPANLERLVEEEAAEELARYEAETAARAAVLESSPDFIPAREFQGRRPGYVFKRDFYLDWKVTRLGYWKDPPPEQRRRSSGGARWFRSWEIWAVVAGTLAVLVSYLKLGTTNPGVDIL